MVQHALGRKLEASSSLGTRYCIISAPRFTAFWNSVSSLDAMEGVMRLPPPAIAWMALATCWIEVSFSR